jgi:hypothetical protein
LIPSILQIGTNTYKNRSTLTRYLLNEENI